MTVPGAKAVRTLAGKAVMASNALRARLVYTGDMRLVGERVCLIYRDPKDGGLFAVEG